MSSFHYRNNIVLYWISILEINRPYTFIKTHVWTLCVTHTLHEHSSISFFPSCSFSLIYTDTLCACILRGEITSCWISLEAAKCLQQFWMQSGNRWGMFRHILGLFTSAQVYEILYYQLNLYRKSAGNKLKSTLCMSIILYEHNSFKMSFY